MLFGHQNVDAMHSVIYTFVHTPSVLDYHHRKIWSPFSGYQSVCICVCIFSAVETHACNEFGSCVEWEKHEEM